MCLYRTNLECRSESRESSSSLTAGRLHPLEVMVGRGFEAKGEGSVGAEDVVKEEAVTLSSLNEDQGEGRRGERGMRGR